MLFSAFKDYIHKNDMLSTGTRVLAAVSGGADSVCLLHLLNRLKNAGEITLFCAHVNHGLRPAAARDEQFVKDICKEWEIPLFTEHADVKKVAQEKKISEETAGREVRYAFFEKICEENNINITFTAHNKCDNAETVLMHLLRGSGLTGLSGIAPIRDGKIARPLLPFERCEIEEYLVNNGIKWIEDETNATDAYARNRIRHRLLPLLSEFNPRAVDAITSCAEIVRREDAFMDKAAIDAGGIYEENGEVFIDTKKLENADLAIIYRVIGYALDMAGCDAGRVNTERVYALFEKKGRLQSLSGSFMAEREGDKIVIYKACKSESFCYDITPSVPTFIKEAGISILAEKCIAKGDGNEILYGGGKISVRSRRNGDIFSPSGMRGSKKLKEFFIDMKMPRRLRDGVPILTVDEKIAYVYPLRRDNKFIPKKGDDALIIHIRGEA